VGASGITKGFPLKADLHTSDTFHSRGKCKAQETDQQSNTVEIALKPSYPIFAEIPVDLSSFDRKISLLSEPLLERRGKGV